MKYEYKCQNKDCKEYNDIFIIDLPMSESSKEIYCKTCKMKCNKVFNFNGGIKTGDGYKK